MTSGDGLGGFWSFLLVVIELSEEGGDEGGAEAQPAELQSGACCLG